MEESKKDIIKLKFAICLTRLISQNKGLSGSKNDIDIVSSLRQLEAASGVSYPIIQQTSVGKRDIHLSTALRLIESLNLKASDFFKLYENLTEQDLKEGAKEIEERNKKQVKRK
ncbi:MAG TPA: hypothetical protein VL098_05885 [Flavipsychrobacter sp.]|nr:hypothetical protein [Flavipsychrobacter sp.]